MTVRQFLLAILALLLSWSAAQAGLFHWWPPAAASLSMALYAGLLFYVFCILMFLLGNRALRSSNRNTFTGLVLASVFGKMVAALLLLFVYRRVYLPADNWYVAVFLMNYLVFTGFEVWFLLRLVRRGGEPR